MLLHPAPKAFKGTVQHLGVPRIHSLPGFILSQPDESESVSLLKSVNTAASGFPIKMINAKDAAQLDDEVK